MANTPSITAEFSPKQSLPTRQPIIEEAKAHCFVKPTSDNATPSHIQKVNLGFCVYILAPIEAIVIYLSCYIFC